MPEWAAPMTPDDFAEFRGQLDEALGPAGFELGDGELTVHRRTGRYGLTNLVQQWVRATSDGRAGLVADHFSRLFEAEDRPPPTAEETLSMLRPRLWRTEMVDGFTFPLITRPVAEDLHEVLCVDLPTAVVNLKSEQAEEIGRPVDDLWAVAHDQIDDGLDVGQEALGPGITACFGDSFFVASRLLDLERFAGTLPEEGALVAVPHRHMLLIHRIATLEALTALNLLAQMAESMFREGPGSIVPHVYWCRPGQRIQQIPAVVERTRVNIAPPEEFTEVLSGLPG